MAIQDWYNKIELAAVWLTSDGTSTGDPLISSVEGLDGLVLSNTWQTITAIDGTAYIQNVSPRTGVVLTLTFPLMPSDMFADVVDAIDTAATGATTLALSIAGEAGSFDLDVTPNMPDCIKFGGNFLTDKIKDIKLSFVVSAVN